MPKLSEVTSQQAQPSGRRRLSEISAQPAPRPSLFRADSDFREKAGVGIGDMAWAAARDMFGSRQGAAEYLAGEINDERGVAGLMGGGASVVQDEAGEPMIRLPDGTRYRLNDPGLDSADVGNVAGNVAAFFLPASWAARFNQAKNIGLLGRAGTQAAAAAGADVGLQLATEGEVDPFRTFVTGVGGAGGEVVGTALAGAANRVGGLLRSQTSARDQAMKMLTDSGIPAPTPQMVDDLAKSIGQVEAGADPRAILGSQLYGFQYTQGQRTADPMTRLRVMTREEPLRQMPGSQEVFARAEMRNKGLLDDALNKLTGRLGLAADSPADAVGQTAGILSKQAQALGARVDDAYSAAREAGPAYFDVDSLRTLPGRIRGRLAESGRLVNPNLNPATTAVIEQMEASLKGLRPGTRGISLEALENQRRIIGGAIENAGNAGDRAALALVKREFDAYLDEAIENALIRGDASTLEALKNARGLRAEFGRRFEGNGDADKFIEGLVNGTRTPEELLNVALGAGQVSKASGARFIERLKVAADGDPQVLAGLRSAHLMRLTRGKSGEALTPGQILFNFRSTKYGNDSLLKALYTPEQWTEVQSLVNALEPMIAPDQLAKSSGTAERLMRTLFQRFAPGVPLVGQNLEAAAAGVNAVRADRAFRAPLRPELQALTGSQPTAAALMREAGR